MQIQEYLEKYKSQIQIEFSQIRSSFRDSDVKGASNENVLKHFLEKHLKFWHIEKGKIIIDSTGNSSSEVDILLCDSRYTWETDVHLPVLVEAVDCAIQVKALLDKKELNRAELNLEKIKALKKGHTKGDSIYGPYDIQSDVAQNWLDRVVTVLFVYETKMAEKTLDKEIKKLENIDAVFILGKNLFYCNHHDGGIYGWKSKNSGTEEKVSGWIKVYTGDTILYSMIEYIVKYVPTITRVRHPLNHYFEKNLSGLRAVKI